MGPRVDGEHHELSGVFVCDDCYWGAFDELEAHGAGRLGIRRGG